MNKLNDKNFDEDIYQELKKLANKLMSKERLNHTLSPTDLVHEAYAVLLKSESEKIHHEQYFFILARQMRRLLVNYGRYKSSVKHGGKQRQVLYTDALGINNNQVLDFSLVSESIDELELINKRCAKAIDLCYFTAIDRDEIAKILDISLPTLERDLRFAKAFISQFIDDHNITN